MKARLKFVRKQDGRRPVRFDLTPKARKRLLEGRAVVLQVVGVGDIDGIYCVKLDRVRPVAACVSDAPTCDSACTSARCG